MVRAFGPVTVNSTARHAPCSDAAFDWLATPVAATTATVSVETSSCFITEHLLLRNVCVERVMGPSV
jgi:hypothetical protein